MKITKQILALTSIFLMSSTMAATTGNLTLTGVVSNVLAISVTPAAISSNLNLSTTQTDLAVASVTEESNSNTGYKISASSANNSSLKRSGGTQLVAYTIKYNGSLVNLGSSASTPVVVKTVSSAAVANNSSAVSISYSGASAASMVAGTYSDTITFTIAAN